MEGLKQGWHVLIYALRSDSKTEGGMKNKAREK